MDSAEQVARFWSKVAVGRENECWLWHGARMKDGYGNIKWDGAYWRAHRLAYYLEYGSVPAMRVIAHTCDTPLCVNPRHLFLATHSENMADMARKHRTKWERHPELTKITRSDASAMRAMYATGMYTQRQIQERYGLSQSHTSAILGGRRWKDS